MGIILSVLSLEVSLYNVCISNQFQTTFAQGEGGVESIVEVTVNSKEERSKTFVPIMSKNWLLVDEIGGRVGAKSDEGATSVVFF